MKINGNAIKEGNVIEHNNGLWIAVKVSHVKPGKGGAFAQIELKNLNFRSSVDTRVEKISRKIRDAEIKKIPYMLVIGDKEKKSNTVSVRKKTVGDIGKLKISDFLKLLNEDISIKTN